MKVSIITPCFNSFKTIRSTLESLEAQRYSNTEYIIIDGGSTDGTLEIINEYSSIFTHIVSEPDFGLYDAINKGVDLASGDIIGILNSDDFYPNRNVINRVVSTFLQNVDAKLVLGNVDFVDGSDLGVIVRHDSSFNFSPWKMRFGFMPAMLGTFVKRSVYDKVGRYKMGYKIAADFDFLVRTLIIQNFPYVCVNKTFVIMRIGGISTAGMMSYYVITKEILRSLKENDVYSNISFVLVRLPIKFIQTPFLKNFFRRWF
jgi:glycosyltransferase involved in cell wall biosynthesis